MAAPKGELTRPTGDASAPATRTTPQGTTFYRPYDGADAHFDPEDHTEVDGRLGLSGVISGAEIVIDDLVTRVGSSERLCRARERS